MYFFFEKRKKKHKPGRIADDVVDVNDAGIAVESCTVVLVAVFVVVAAADVIFVVDVIVVVIIVVGTV